MTCHPRVHSGEIIHRGRACLACPRSIQGLRPASLRHIWSYQPCRSGDWGVRTRYSHNRLDPGWDSRTLPAPNDRRRGCNRRFVLHSPPAQSYWSGRGCRRNTRGNQSRPGFGPCLWCYLVLTWLVLTLPCWSGQCLFSYFMLSKSHTVASRHRSLKT